LDIIDYVRAIKALTQQSKDGFGDSTMGWETRRGGKLYFYESRWEDGRVVRRYVGNGPRARAAAQAIIDRNERRRRAALEVARVKEKLVTIEAQTKELQQLATLLSHAHLLSDGFYQSSYSWRKRKRNMDAIAQSVPDLETATTAIAPDTPPSSHVVGVPKGMPFRLASDTNSGNEKVGRPTKQADKSPPKRRSLKRKRRASQPEAQPLSRGASTTYVAREPTPKPSPEVTGKNTAKDVEPKLAAKPLTKLEELTAHAKTGSAEGVRELRDHLESHPEIYRQVGDLARAARYGWAGMAAGDSALQREAIFRRGEEVMARYKGDRDICPTEEVLIEQIVVCSMRVNYFDFQTANHAESENTKLANLLLKKHESAQNQLYKAMAQLENYRRLQQL